MILMACFHRWGIGNGTNVTLCDGSYPPPESLRHFVCTSFLILINPFYVGASRAFLIIPEVNRDDQPCTWFADYSLREWRGYDDPPWRVGVTLVLNRRPICFRRTDDGNLESRMSVSSLPSLRDQRRKRSQTLRAERNSNREPIYANALYYRTRAISVFYFRIYTGN